MAFTIKTMTALAALLVAAPGVSALGGIANASSPLLPQVPEAGDIGVGIAPRDGNDPVDAALDTATDTLATVGHLSTCRLAVPVHAVWYTGTVTDRRTTEDDWLVEHAWHWTTQE